MFKKLIIFITCLMFSLIVFASNDWREVGSDNVNSYVQDDGQSYVSDNYTIINKTIGSLTEPLIADFDNDGINEIIIFRDSEIRLYSSANYNLDDVYVNSTITITGNAEIIDWDDDGILELIFISNIAGTNHSFMVFSYNSSLSEEFVLEKIIHNVTANSGMNCFELYNNKIECCYVGTDGNFYCYDETNSFPTTPKLSIGGDDCIDGSRPSYIDVNNDGINDVIFIYDLSCTELIISINNDDGTFTNIYNITTGSLNAISQFIEADIDGGIRELVITDSNYCELSVNSCDGSYVSIYRIDNGNSICDIRFKNEFQWDSPYITGLHSCIGQEGVLNCDYNNDGFNDIYFLRINANVDNIAHQSNATLTVIDNNCDILFESETEILETVNIGVTNVQDDRSTTLYGKAVWQNFDLDSQYELYVWDRIINKDGTTLILLYDRTHQNEWINPLNRLVLGDINGDSNNELINQNTSDFIQIISFVFDNQLPFLLQVEWNTGNPICNNTIVNYNARFFDREDDFVRIAIDCLNNGTIINGTFSIDDPTSSLNCLYDKIGNFETIIYLQDISHSNNYETFYSRAVSITISEFCNEAGQQGSASNVTVVGSTGGMDDWASTIPDALSEFGFRSVASKVFFGIFIIIALIMVANAKYKSAFVSIVISMLGMVALVYIGIFPLWLVFIMFIFTALLVFLAIFKLSSGGSAE